MADVLRLRALQFPPIGRADGEAEEDDVDLI